ncbi:MAG: O-antigen polymerase [Acidobacteriota bacterium]
MTQYSNGRTNLASQNNMAAATLIICVGVITAVFLLPADNPNATFNTAALIVGLVLAVALVVEAQGGLRVLLRTDILMLVALYGLTLLEFLFPQPDFSHLVLPESAVIGTQAVLYGFAGIAIGRHLVSPLPSATTAINRRYLSPKTLFNVFLGLFILGYLYIFLSVNFDLWEMLQQMTYSRFSQAWSRGRIGGWVSLLTELGLLIYLLPPIAGVVLARWEEFSTGQKLVVFTVLALTLFYGFSGGTRSIFITHLLTFASGYLLFKKNLKTWQIVGYGAVFAVLAGIAVFLMLEFRTTGLANYSVSERKTETLFVDNNIIVISRLTDVFPSKSDYLGLEIPFNALIRPIPRALWLGKPEGLSTGIEEALGAEGLTLAATFVGESYMSGGLFAVIIASVLLGVAAGWWNRRGQDLDSDFNLLLYVSGFFAAALSMRSILQVVPALLPTIALWVYGRTRFLKLVRSQAPL